MNPQALPLAALFLTLPALAAQAQDSASTVKVKASPELFTAGYLVQVVGSLLLVFICLFVVVYLLKRFNNVGAGAGSALRVLGSVSVGQREKVVLLDVGGEQLLLGVAQGSVRTLHVLPEPIVNSTEGEGQSADFASVLRAANPLGGRS